MTTQIEKIRAIYDQHGEFPGSWTRYIAIDPGTAKCAVLFGVVPEPDEFGDRLILEDEIFARRMPPSMLAPEVATKVGTKNYEAFVMDAHAAKQTTIGAERTVEEQYSDAFAQNGVESAQTGSHFWPGTDDVMARANEVREWMNPSQKGGPRLLIVMEKCLQTKREFRLYKRRVKHGRSSDGNLVSEEPIRQYDDCMNALEYLIGIHPWYAIPAPEAPAPDLGYLDWERRKKRRDKAHGQGVQLGPPVPIGA